MTSIQSRKLLTVDELAELLRLQPETVRQMARDRRIPGRKIGHVWRFDSTEIDNWLSPESGVLPSSDNVKERVASDDKVHEQQVLELYKHETGENGSTFRDPAFTENRKERIHRWVPWIAGFSSKFVRDCFDRYSPDQAEPESVTILDPFAGVGTTLVEAIRRGHQAYGFEVNPYAALVTRAKVECCEVTIEDLKHQADKFVNHMAFVSQERIPQPEGIRPVQFRSRIPFYSAPIEMQVLHALDFIRRIDNKAIRDLFLVAFGSVMVKFSNYSYEPSLASRPGSGKSLIEYADVPAIIAAKLHEIISDMRQFQSEPGVRETAARTRVYTDSIFRWDLYLDEGGIDLIVTSPPYLNNYHYIRNTRPHLFWLELVHETNQLKQIELESFGKFWQTVRDAPPINLTFQMSELQGLLDALRDTNVGKGTYGGGGWANYAATYFNDTFRFCKAMTRLLRPGRRAVIVIGNSILQGLEVKTDRFLAQIGESCGLHCEAIHALRNKRVGNSIISSSARNGPSVESNVRLYEVAVVLSRKA